MKNRALAVITVIFLVITGVNVMAVHSDNDHTIESSVKEDHFLFSRATIETEETYVSVNLAETSSFLMEPGKPMLPVYTKTFTFPFGTKIKNVNCSILDISEMEIAGKIKPSPKLVPKISVETPKSDTDVEQIVEDKTVYSNSDLYPDTWYDYSICCGRKDDQSVIRVTVRCYPLRYSPMENIIYQTESVDVKITYEKPLPALESDSKYDMVIIAPSKFSFRLQPLIDHKNKLGLNTTLKTTESIYREARQGMYISKGRDRAEKIKLFIHWAKENWDIKYVLLFGGKQRQSLLRWYVPVRYSHLDDQPWDDPNWETSYLSDLYFADIYRYNETKGDYEFEDWDSNGNNIFAEWTFKGVYDEDLDLWRYVVDKKDVLDLDPDVYVGRLLCRNIFEAKTVVNKIITYESTPIDPSWFKKMLLVGGDTFPGNNEYYEGEMETNHAASFMEPLGFIFEKLWVSNGNLKGTEDVINAINQGAGFIFFAGHGSPIDWGTHPPNNDTVWVDGLINFEMKKLKNDNKLPIVIVGGCHNSQFDVSFMNLVAGVLKYRLRYFILNMSRDCFHKWRWIPRCWSWNLVRQKNGGSIATIGNTGLGWGVSGPNSINYQDGYISSHFFQVYATLSNQGNHSLGEIHGQTISDFIGRFTPNDDSDPKDRKTVEQWALFGDPSLKIGGYPQ